MNIWIKVTLFSCATAFQIIGMDTTPPTSIISSDVNGNDSSRQHYKAQDNPREQEEKIYTPETFIAEFSKQVPEVINLNQEKVDLLVEFINELTRNDIKNTDKEFFIKTLLNTQKSLDINQLKRTFKIYMKHLPPRETHTQKIFKTKTKEKYEKLIAQFKWAVDPKKQTNINAQPNTILSDSELSDEDKRIIVQLMNNDDSHSNPCRVVAFKPKSGGSTDKIFKITRCDGSKVIGKLFKKLSFMKAELENLKRIQSYIENIKRLSLDPSNKIPVIMDFLKEMIVDGDDEEKGIILISRAYGETLEEIREKIDQNKIEKTRIIEIFKNIGKQLGTLDSILYKEYGKILRNSDSVDGNYTFSEKKMQFYWIDTERVSWLSNEPAHDQQFLSNTYRFIKQFNNLNNLPGPKIPIPDDTIALEIQTQGEAERYFPDAERYFPIAQNRWLAVKCIYEGYSQALKQHGIDNSNIFKEYEDLIKNNPYRAMFEKLGKHLDPTIYSIH